GLAFQITDDILDATSAPEILGKDVNKDAERASFVKFAGVDGARQICGELAQTSIDAVEPLGESAAPLRELATLVRDRVR
ncbi:MAG TPA: polyprenyl synthetase family protein, partial [Thermoanaerobaculia bacterium]|nr:polyprenyl synthetase family protein [Thermoanaerobaculia bacterium]